jgi:hypothetical protein
LPAFARLARFFAIEIYGFGYYTSSGWSGFGGWRA